MQYPIAKTTIYNYTISKDRKNMTIYIIKVRFFMDIL